MFNKELTEISYEEDIAREVSENTGLDYERCLAVQRNMFKFIVEQTKERDIYAIHLPNLGIIYQSKIKINDIVRDLRFQLKHKEDEELQKKHDFWQHRQARIEMYKDESNTYKSRTKHYLLPLASKFRCALPPQYENYKYAGARKSGEIYAAVEELQNINYNKK